jgi:hypothetical protein
MREALSALWQRLRAGEPRWHTWQELDTARAMPVREVLAALEGCRDVTAAGVHAASFQRYAGRPMQVLPAHDPLGLASALRSSDALVITDARWSALLLRAPALLNSVALNVRRTLVAPLRVAAEPVRARWSTAFYEPAEASRRHYWKWCGRARGGSEISLFLDVPEALAGTLSFAVLWPNNTPPGKLEMVLDGGARRVPLPSQRRVQLPLGLSPGRNSIVFETDRAPVSLAGDSRELSFAIADLRWRATKGTAELAPAAAYGLDAAAGAGGIRLSAAEQALHAAGFWTVRSLGAHDGSSGPPARASRGVVEPVVEGGARGATAGIVWLLADRRQLA